MDSHAVRLDDAVSTLDRIKPESSDGREFWSFESASIAATGLTLLLDLSLSIHNALDQLASETVLPDNNGSLVAEFTESQAENWHEALGWRIVSAVDYMTREEMGIYGPTMSLFPLWTLINILPRDYVPYERAHSLLIRAMKNGRTRHPLELPQADEKPNRRVVVPEDPKVLRYSFNP